MLTAYYIIYSTNRHSIFHCKGIVWVIQQHEIQFSQLIASFQLCIYNSFLYFIEILKKICKNIKVHIIFLPTPIMRVPQNVNIEGKSLIAVTNRYIRQSLEYSLQHQEFHLTPPALILSGISTHLVRFPSLKGFLCISARCHLLVAIKYYIVTISFCVATQGSSNICILAFKTINCEMVHP